LKLGKAKKGHALIRLCPSSSPGQSGSCNHQRIDSAQLAPAGAGMLRHALTGAERQA